ncbi:hypothetical protein CN553_31255 [Bacillus cereus]|uniref:Transposase n=1 Tax=Bacillus cereus TaxID=1396 RepID=A0A9X6YJA1_BACCE|nr:hypothetical protein [Bacillus cereus]PEN77317.1 hypothetical protein CN553_31255 [Bacillus cereus]
MSTYSVEMKLTVINTYLNSGESLRTIGSSYNTNNSLVHRWVIKYNQHGISAYKNTYTKYSTEFKLYKLNSIMTSLFLVIQLNKEKRTHGSEKSYNLQNMKL